MLRGLYIAGTGMILQRQRMNVVTNNLTNVETTGYKKDGVAPQSFEDVMISRLRDYPSLEGNQVGPLTYGAYSDEVYTDFTQGPLEQSYRMEDLALEGEGFFVVNTPNGVRYTRAGDFFVNPNGYLVTQDGNYVLSTNNTPLLVGQGDFAVAQDGTVTNAGGVRVGQLRLVNFANTDNLRKDGNNLYTVVNNEAALPANNVSVRQGYLENSNVDTAREMVDMMEIYRSYEINQRIVRMTDETLGKAVSEIGRVG